MSPLCLAARKLSWLLAEVLSPSRCLSCGSPSSQAVWCAECQRELPHSAPQQRQDQTVLAPFRYGGPVRQAIHQLKYGHRVDLCAALGEVLGQYLHEHGVGRGHALVPVPLHPKRLATRGYNQAALIARAAARVTGSSCCPRLLERVRDTEQQASLDSAARRTNVAGAFRCRAPRRPLERPVVVIDDVVTTGQTACRCVEALSQVEISVSAIAALALAPEAATPKDSP